MQIVVKGKNLDLSESLKSDTIQKLSKVRKQFDRFIDMEVVFSEDKNPRIEHPYHCEVVLHAKGKYLRASAAAADPVAAVDLVEQKLSRQVRKWKTRIVARAHGGGHRHERDEEPLDTTDVATIADEGLDGVA